MALPVKLATLVATATAASAAAWWVLTPPGADTTPRSTPEQRPPAQSTPIAGGDGKTVCVSRDRVLRAPPADGRCPPGDEELDLEPDKDDRLCELCDPYEDPPTPDPEPRNAALDSLEERIRDLENTAYFEVVNAREQTIFRVGPGGVRVFNGNGRAVAAIGTSETGGYFTARSTTTAAEVSIGASGTRAGVRFMEVGMARLDLGTTDGSYALRLPSAAGLIAGLGQSRAGSGALLVGTLPGHLRTSLTSPGERGMVTAVNQVSAGGLALTEATIGGGMVDLGDSRGNSAVKMGHNGHRYGVVLAGPVLGLPLVPRSGLPGSYFMGCASEERPACAPAVP